jgi:hypothetical protein
MAVNLRRSETEITLGGEHYILRPTFEALSKIEWELDMGIFALIKKMADGAMTLQELAVVIGLCIVSDIPMPGIKDMIVGGGMANALAACSRMFSIALGDCDEQCRL